MITREQVADLHPGDVVELVRNEPGMTTTIRAELRPYHDTGLILGESVLLRLPGGEVPALRAQFELTVISRAPRPLYVNHDRYEPTQGDVVWFEDQRNPADSYTNLYDPSNSLRLPWLEIQTGYRYGRDEAETGDPDLRLHLLIDGTTGQLAGEAPR